MVVNKRNKTSMELALNMDWRMSLRTAILLLTFNFGTCAFVDSKAMEGLSCRQVPEKVQICTGKNEEFRIGFFNSRTIGTMKLKMLRRQEEKECNSSVVASRETIFPTLMDDEYGKLRFIMQDEENDLTQTIQLATCGGDCENGTIEVEFTKYNLVSWDPIYNYFDPQVISFKVPTCCHCKVGTK